ncbi:hypothetical protein GCM10027592_29490 [Spirosoma flavus]
MKYEITQPGAVLEELWQEKTVRVLSGGFNLNLTNYPAGQIHLKKGTPLFIDFANRTATPVKTALVNVSIADGVLTFQTPKRSLLKVGDIIGNGTKAATITAIDTSNTAYDSVTVDATLGAQAAGAVLTSSTSAGNNKALLAPNALAYADVKLEGQQAVSAVYEAHEVSLSKLPYQVTAAMQISLTSRFLFVP